MPAISLAQVLLAALCLAGVSSAAEPEVIPSLRQWQDGEGVTTFDAGTRIVISGDELAAMAGTLAQEIAAISGSGPAVVKGEAKAHDIVLALDVAMAPHGEEGYRIEAGDRLRISAAHLTGIHHGTRTLLQVMAGGGAFPQGATVDCPKYDKRGITLDVARKFYTMDYLRRLVRELAWFKLNVLHLHLTDDQAFRLECETFPGLTAKDGHYTKREMRELIELGARHGVTVVPEINAPGHVSAILRYRPELGSHGAFDLKNPGGMEFVKKLWAEYLDPKNPVFVGPLVHMGSDEVEAHSQEDRELMRVWLNEMSAFIRGYGKEVRAWGGLDRYTGTTPVNKELQMDLWNWGWGNAATAFPTGHKLNNIDDSKLYIVPYSGIYRDYLDTKDLYLNWEPNLFPGLTVDAGHPQMVGANLAIWNDRSPSYGISMDDTTERLLAALPVFSEKCWHGARKDADYAVFLKRSKVVGNDPLANLRYIVPTVAKDGRLLEYCFDGSLEDLSGNGRAGTSYEADLVPGEYGQALRLKGGKSYMATPVSAKGFGYSVSFSIKPDAGNPADAVILESPEGKLTLNTKGGGKLGFAKEDYITTFDYSPPENTWTDITITGDADGTCLYVNGDEHVERLVHQVKLNTFVLPLARIGSETNSFIGAIDNFLVLDRAVDLLGVNRNLAFGKAATASSWELNRDELAPGKAVDGDLSTRWSTAQIPDGWLKLDLGSVQTIDRAVIHWEIQRGAQYKLLVSTDGETWTNVVPHDGSFIVERRFDPLEFPPVQSRYVKFQGTKLSNWGYAMFEFELYGPGGKLDAGYKAKLKEARDALRRGDLGPDLRAQFEKLVAEFPFGGLGER